MTTEELNKRKAKIFAAINDLEREIINHGQSKGLSRPEYMANGSKFDKARQAIRTLKL